MKEKKIPLFLAPMAGAGDRAFRESCALWGADFFCTEMISAKAVCYGDKKTGSLAQTGSAERPIAIQFFGSDPDLMAKATELLATKDRADWVDLNFGCPVPKIVNNGEGSALMRSPDLIFQIVSSVVSVSKLPVSVKIRAGWDKSLVNAPQIASLCEKAGAKRIAVHARLRSDFYRDKTVDLSVISEVKRAVSIPVIGNGDVRDGESALRMLEETGCDGLMIGRAAIGAPWVFAEIRAALEGKEMPLPDRKDAIRNHLRLAFCYKSEAAGREMRMHMAQYLKGFRGAAALRDAASHAQTPEDYDFLVDQLQ